MCVCSSLNKKNQVNKNNIVALLLFLQDTGEILMPQDLKKAQTYGGKRICFENDEVTEIKRFGTSGRLTFVFIYSLTSDLHCVGGLV